MKRILLTLTLVLIGVLLINAKAKNNGTKDSIPNASISVTYTPSYSDTDESGETVVSTESAADSTLSDEDSYDSSQKFTMSKQWDIDDFGDDFGSGLKKSIALGFLALLLVFGTPVIIVALALYFRYKNRRNRYRVIEKALESGQPIPDEFVKQNMTNDTESKGIKNICLGLGLFIFLWALTTFAIGCIGILIMCNGIGQYVVARKKRNSEQN